MGQSKFRFRIGSFTEYNCRNDSNGTYNAEYLFEILKESIHNEFKVKEIPTVRNPYHSELHPCASEKYGPVDQYELKVKAHLHPHELSTVVLADITLKDSNQFIFEFRKFDQTNITVDIIKDIINFLVGV